MMQDQGAATSRQAAAAVIVAAAVFVAVAGFGTHETHGPQGTWMKEPALQDKSATTPYMYHELVMAEPRAATNKEQRTGSLL